MLLSAIVTTLTVSGALQAIKGRVRAAKDGRDYGIAIAQRCAVGATAIEDGPTREISGVCIYTEVPPDPAFGGIEVLLTSEEVIWWMSASSSPEDFIPEIRKILHEQPLRRAVCSVL